MRRCAWLAAGALTVVVALAVLPSGDARFDAFDLAAALIATALGVVGCLRLKAWTSLTSIAFVAALVLMGLETGNRVAGYPDKEMIGMMSWLWAPLVGWLAFRRQRLALACLPGLVALGWLTFGARQLAYRSPALDQPASRLTIHAVSKVTGGRLWAFGCLDALPVVAVYRLPASLEDVRQMPDGQGSMDAQIGNVPLPFRRLLRCARAPAAAPSHAPSSRNFVRLRQKTQT